MKKKILLAISIIIAIFLTSCKEDLENLTPNNSFQDEELNVVVQKRNSSLPTATKKRGEVMQTRSGSSSEIINTDFRLGYAYRLKNGNYILGDAANIGNQVIDINAIKAYDPTSVYGIKLNTTETNAFSYSTFDRYYHKSRITKKVTTGFSLDFKFFSIGIKNTITNTFNKLITNTSQSAFGELNVCFVNKQFLLQNSEANRRLYARRFLTKSFIRSLYNSPISSTLNTYGDFVLTGYKTGGKAHAGYFATTNKTLNQNEKESGVDLLIDASLKTEKKENNYEAKLNIGYDKSNYEFIESKFDLAKTYIYMKTFGGKQNTTNAEVKAVNIKDVNINLTPWMHSLSDESTHTMIDLADNGLSPLSGFVLETNFKQRIDDTSNEVLPSYTRLVVPYIEIVRVFVRSTPNYEPLYDVAAVLVTRKADRIILNNGLAQSASDEELRKNQDNAVFMEKVKKISTEKSKLFSSDIEISYNKRTKLNPVLRSPLCIELRGFKEQNFYRFFYEKTGIEYIYNKSSHICFSYFKDEDDDEVLDIYGIRNWVESLPVKKISIASLANHYKIIGL